ncbi:hypothetical protein KAX17_07830, partial [Candidatus Bipolaricaulota bacterium]|nr:hypothetical protein [Candidatus Bipolaricaulota bacterium]
RTSFNRPACCRQVMKLIEKTRIGSKVKKRRVASSIIGLCGPLMDLKGLGEGVKDLFGNRHSVERRCSEASQYFPEIAKRAERWSMLGGYYIATRYPNSLPGSIPSLQPRRR